MPRIGRALIRGFQNVGHMAIRAFNGPPQAPSPHYTGTQDPVGPPAGLGNVAFYQQNAVSVSNIVATGLTGPLGGARTRIAAGTRWTIVNRLGTPQNVDIGDLYVTDWEAAETIAHGVTQVQSTMFDPAAFAVAIQEGRPPTPGFDQGLTAHKHTAMIKVAAPGTPPAAGWQAFAMPWDGRGGAVYMTLPRGPGPNLFYTDLLSGCSVFVVGPRDNPRVYHCGLNPGGYNVPAGTDAADLWSALVEHNEVTRFGATAGVDYPSIDKYHYIKDSGAPAGAATGVEAIIEARLAARPGVAAAPPPTANARGAVFGIRDGAGNWSFYLQTNVVMSWTDTANVKHSEGRPVSVKQFYPRPETSVPGSWTF